MRHVIIGTPATCQQLDAQLALLTDPPETVGWIYIESNSEVAEERRCLGTLEDLEALLSKWQLDQVLVALPAAMTDLIINIPTRLRRLGIADRFMPTLDDQLTGRGPRTNLEIDTGALLGRRLHAIDDASISRSFRNRRVLVTGAGGSIGSELSRMLAQCKPSQLVLIDRAENALFEIDRQIAQLAPDLSRCAVLHDVVDAAATEDYFRKFQPQIIFHAAAHKHVPMMEDHPGAAIDNNLFGTKAVADASAAVGAERFVLISSDKAVNPSSMMGATKRLAELYVQWMSGLSDTNFSMVRFGNVLGSAGSVLDIWKRQIANGRALTVTHPEMTRYFMTIPEATSLVLQAATLETEPGGAVFLLDMGAPISILELARSFAQQYGLMPIERGRAGEEDKPVEVGEIEIIFTGPRPGEKLHEKLAFDAEAMVPTQHPSINLWRLSDPQEGQINRALTQLAKDARPRDPLVLGGLIRDLVPEMVKPMAI